uniref:Uncharacterized protein n=2 Tax=Avena sativa TaxID=4498 RepID=A0ACD5U2P6_AVESA
MADPDPHPSPPSLLFLPLPRRRRWRGPPGLSRAGPAAAGRSSSRARSGRAGPPAGGGAPRRRTGRCGGVEPAAGWPSRRRSRRRRGIRGPVLGGGAADTWPASKPRSGPFGPDLGLGVPRLARCCLLRWSEGRDSMSGAIQWGVTAPRLLDPPTDDDYNRTEQLKQFLDKSHLSMDLTDLSKRQNILKELYEVVKTCVKDIVSEKYQLTEAPHVSVLTFGSYQLGVHIPSDDLEIVCFGPPLVECQDFFKALHGALGKNGIFVEVESLHKEKSLYGSSRKKEENPELKALENEKAIEFKHSPADFVKFKQQGISVVLTYAIISGVPLENLNILKDDGLLYHVDEANFPGLDRCRVSALIRFLVPRIENFQVVLRYINFWARKRGLYSNVTGYLRGVHWAVLVARMCQVYPEATPSVLAMKFFKIYSQWYWPSPVMLYEIIMKPDLPFDVWDAPNKLDDFSHLMPIISPAYPAWNLSACVSESTRRVMNEEFIRGNEICKKIKLGEANWSDLCEPLEFFKLYNLYLQFDIRAKNLEDLKLWKVAVEPLWRKLIIKIEAHGDCIMKCHLCPTEYAYDDAEHHSVIFVGIKREKTVVSGLMVSIPLPVDNRLVNVFNNEVNARKEPGMDLVFSQFRISRMPDSVKQLVFGSGVSQDA